MIATTEHINSEPIRVRALLMHRNIHAAGRLDLVQSITLNSDVTRNTTTFAPFAGGNVICAIWGSRSLHDLCRSQGASGAVFENTARAHPLPKAVLAVCSLHSESNGEWRLAASLDDNTLRVFGVACHSERIAAASAASRQMDTKHSRGIPGGSVILQSLESIKPYDSYYIEFYMAQQNGLLAAPKLIYSQDTGIYLIGLMPPALTFPNFRLVAFEWKKNDRGIGVYPVAINKEVNRD